jgi:hypothetical protein
MRESERRNKPGYNERENERGDERKKQGIIQRRGKLKNRR